MHAFQCVGGVLYTFPEICDERQFFTKHAAQVIMAINDDISVPKTQLLTKVVQAVETLLDQDDELEQVLHLESIQYGQLMKKNLSEAQIQRSRDPPANNTAYVPEENFESFTICLDASGSKTTVKRYVQAPRSEGGWYAELTGDRGLKFKTVLEFKVKVDMDVDEDGDGPCGPLAPRRTEARKPLIVCMHCAQIHR